MKDCLDIRALSVAFEKKRILENINLSIPDRKILAVIGPSGCGKTTLLKTLNRMVQEEQAKVDGEVLFKGENIMNMDPTKLRTEIGMVFQQPVPFPLSVYQNLAYALQYHGVKSKRDLKEVIAEKLKLCGLYEEVKAYLHKSALKLSGGQQQRLCIARTLCVEPEVLLMDEPCSSLDVHNTKLIEELLMKLSQSYTIVIVTHNLQQAKRIADYTAFFLEGKLIEMNRTEEFFKNPKAEESKEYLQGLYG